MRVLYAAFDVVPSPKGAGTHIARFVEALAERFRDVTLCTPGSAPSRPESRYYGARHIRVCPPDGNYLQQALFFRDRVAELLRAERYDVVHFRCIWAGMPAVYAAARRGFRTVYEANGFPSVELPYHFPGLRSRPDLLRRFRMQEDECLTGAGLVVTPSQVTARHIAERGVPEARIRVIPNGVDPELFRATPLPPADGRPLRLLYVGTLAPWQGVDTLVEALAKARRDADVELHLLAPDKRAWLRRVRKLAQRLGVEQQVTFLPPCDHANVPDMIARADVCAAPLADTDRNRRQGCNPIKVLEYMACNRPVIAADLPVVREVLSGGETGLLYRPDDPANLRNAILELAGDPALRARLAAAGRELVVTRFTWKRAQEELLRAYDGLTGATTDR